MAQGGASSYAQVKSETQEASLIAKTHRLQRFGAEFKASKLILPQLAF